MSQQHLYGLTVWLNWIPKQLDAMIGSTRGGTGHVLLVPKSLHNCVYTRDEQRDPSQLAPRPAPTDRHCTSTASDVQQRGSQNVPRP